MSELVQSHTRPCEVPLCGRPFLWRSVGPGEWAWVGSCTHQQGQAWPAPEQP